MLAANGKLRMWVQNRSISHLSDAVYAAPAEDGSWWLWWSWPDQLAPIDEVESAAVKIASNQAVRLALREQGRERLTAARREVAAVVPIG